MFKKVLCKNLAFMLGGAAIYESAKQFLKTKTAHNIAVKTVATGMNVKKEVMATIQDIKDEAKDIVEEAKIKE